MHDYPLRFLKTALYPGTTEFISELKRKHKKIAVYSDYPVEQKLKVLDLEVDIQLCSTDKQIEELKPGRKALDLICSEFHCSPEKAVYFGDRIDTDGKSAQMADIAFIKVNTEKARTGEFYRELLNQLAARNE